MQAIPEQTQDHDRQNLLLKLYLNTSPRTRLNNL